MPLPIVASWLCPACGSMDRTAAAPHDCSTCGRPSAKLERGEEWLTPGD
jgi:rubrerythrin